MFFPSPRNSVEAFLSLIKESGVSKFLLPSTVPTVLQPVLEKNPLTQFTIPDLDYFLDETSVEPFPFEATFQQLRRKPWVLLHTSGSTGIPKIITLRHGYPTIIDAFYHLPDNEMYDRLGNTRLFNPFPPSHMAGLLYSTSVVIFANSTIVLPPPTPLTADLAAEVHASANVEFSVLPPAIITELSNKDDCLEKLKTLQGLQFVGGPLAEATGNFMCQYTSLHSSIGATEYFTVPFKPKGTEDWAWFHFDSQDGGVEFWPEDNGLYEMVLVREKRLDLQQGKCQSPTKNYMNFPETCFMLVDRVSN